MNAPDPSILHLSLPLGIARRIPESLVADLQSAVDDLVRWTSTLPRSSKVYVNQRVAARRPRGLPPNVTQRDVQLADTFFDVHSVLAGQCLVKGWRTQQLAEGLVAALSQWNITLAALATRALVETALAWFVESRQILENWEVLKKQAVRKQSDATEIRRELYKASVQIVWGTRLTHIVQEHQVAQRTNILTLVKKAAKMLEKPRLASDYEILCDAVHPSWGATECFWEEAGIAPEICQTRVLLSKDAIGQIASRDSNPVRQGSPLSGTILLNSAFAISRLVADLRTFEIFTRDLCLTGRVHILADLDYWGIVKPTGAYDLCSCGSGRKTRFCRHDFPRHAA